MTTSLKALILLGFRIEVYQQKIDAADSLADAIETVKTARDMERVDE